MRRARVKSALEIRRMLVQKIPATQRAGNHQSGGNKSNQHTSKRSTDIRACCEIVVLDYRLPQLSLTREALVLQHSLRNDHGSRPTRKSALQGFGCSAPRLWATMLLKTPWMNLLPPPWNCFPARALRVLRMRQAWATKKPAPEGKGPPDTGL